MASLCCSDSSSSSWTRHKEQEGEFLTVRGWTQSLKHGLRLRTHHQLGELGVQLLLGGHRLRQQLHPGDDDLWLVLFFVAAGEHGGQATAPVLLPLGCHGYGRCCLKRQVDLSPTQWNKNMFQVWSFWVLTFNYQPIIKPNVSITGIFPK